jgi:hypothetical protein
MIQWFLIGVLVMWCIAAVVDQLHDPYTFESRRPSSLPLDDNDRAAREEPPADSSRASIYDWPAGE